MTKEGGHRPGIISAARKLFSERGFAATSVRDISASAGCNVALISHYFGSKEGLLEAVLRSEMNQDQIELGAALAGGPDPRAEVTRFIGLAVDNLSKNAELLRIGHRELMQPDNPLLDRLLPPIQKTVTALANQLARLPRTDGLDPRLTAILLVGAIQYCFIARPVLSRLLKGDSSAFSEQLKRHLTAIFVGASTKAPISRKKKRTVRTRTARRRAT